MAAVKPGDLVRFSDEVGEGRVIRILSDDMAEVETTDGWVLPSYIRKLVVIPENIKPSGRAATVPKPSEISRAKAEKEVRDVTLNKAPVAKPSNVRTPARVIDLHINKLVDIVVGLSNGEILNFQLDAFRRELNKSISSNEREIVFIHGIGNGTLKSELRRAAEKEYKWCQQEDASFREFGFGATRIRIPQNKPI
jgi:hypothetical protein